MLKGDFTQNMAKVFIIYTGGCLGFAALMGVLELAGLPQHSLGIGFVLLTVGFYALMGMLARTSQINEYLLGGRSVPAMYNGMATAADWMSAASFLGMAGAIYASGYDGLSFVLGWSGGYILVAVLLAPYLRKFGQFTVPDFLGTRYEGDAARLMGVLVLVTASFAYVVGQIYGVGMIASRFLGIDFRLAVYVGLGGTLLCSMLGGMRALIWTQVAQYLVVIAAYIMPAVLISFKETGVPLPQVMYGTVLSKISALQTDLGLAQDAMAPTDLVNFYGVMICLMLGTASLPHVLARYFTTPSVRDARLSVGWSLLFIFFLYFTAPSLAIFAKVEILQSLAGSLKDGLPAWAQAWQQTGFLTALPGGGFAVDPDAVVLMASEAAGLPFVVAGLVAAGALAAAMSSADGLLLSIANTLSQDTWFRFVKPKADPRQRLVVSRLLLILVALLAAFVASTRPAGILTIVGWAFSLAASGLFPALVLGIWWNRTTRHGAVAGMAAGWALCVAYILGVQCFGMAPWFGVKSISAGLFGIPLGFLVTVLVSLVTPAPSAEMQQFIDSIRIPRGTVKLAKVKGK